MRFSRKLSWNSYREFANKIAIEMTGDFRQVLDRINYSEKVHATIL